MPYKLICTPIHPLVSNLESGHNCHMRDIFTYLVWWNYHSHFKRVCVCVCRSKSAAQKVLVGDSSLCVILNLIRLKQGQTDRIDNIATCKSYVRAVTDFRCHVISQKGLIDGVISTIFYKFDCLCISSCTVSPYEASGCSPFQSTGNILGVSQITLFNPLTPKMQFLQPPLAWVISKSS